MTHKPLRFEFRRGGGFKKAALALLITTAGAGLGLFGLTNNPTWLILMACLSVSTLYFLHRKTKITVLWDKNNPAFLVWDDFELPPSWHEFIWYYDAMPANWMQLTPSHGRIRACVKHQGQTILIEQNAPIPACKIFESLPKSPDFNMQTTWHYLAFGRNFLRLLDVTNPDFLENQVNRLTSSVAK